MEVYECEKSLLTRLEESIEVLDCCKSPIFVSQIQQKWWYYIENYIEPTGWQAIWKIPRLICEELKIRYPTCVYGNVDEILFKDLKAIFTVQAVNDDIEIPESHEVNLIDLYPTKRQENDAVDVEKTADCVDKLRFFYNHIWMPWDGDADDDFTWTAERIESRIRFFYDLKRTDMKRALAAHIRMLLTEARYIQSRREYLELDLSDSEDVEVDKLDNLDKSQITDLMRLHLRMNMIKNELEMLENPEMRKIYEETMFDDDKSLKHVWKSEKEVRNSLNCEKSNIYIVTKPWSFEEQLKYLEKAKQFIDANKTIQMCRSLKNVLSICNTSDQIYLPPGSHFMKFLEYFNDDGLICGLTTDIRYNSKERRSATTTIDESDVVIMTQDDESNILIFNGNFTVRNLVLDCRNAQCGALVKNGNVKLENCLILGDAKSSTKRGIIVCRDSNLELENCLIRDLATGILVEDGGKVAMKSCTIFNCTSGLEVEDGSRVELKQIEFVNSKYCAIYYSTNCLINKIDRKIVTYDQIYEMKDDLCESVPWTGNCTFEGGAKQNIVIFNRQASLASSRFEEILSESIENVSNSILVVVNGYDNDVSTENENFCEDSQILISDEEDEEFVIVVD